MLGTATGVRRGRRWQRRLLLAVLAALGASFASVLAEASPLARSTVDRPDDSPEPQIHVLYVLPSDRGDRELDTNGTLESSVAAFQRWLAGQTGGRVLRLDTSGGSLDVTFHRLARSDEDIAGRGASVRDAVEADLKAAGFNAPNKIYAVYYDGTSTHACGGGAWPPELPATWPRCT